MIAMKTIQYILSLMNKGGHKLGLILVFSLIFSSVNYAQELNCFGSVSDELNEDPVEGVDVHILIFESFEDPIVDTILLTDEDGEYELIVELPAPTPYYEILIMPEEVMGLNDCWFQITELPDTVECELIVTLNPPFDCEAAFFFQPGIDFLSIDFFDMSFGDIVSWEWDFGDGNTASGPMVSHTYSQPDDYDVSLTVTDASGLCQDIAIETVDFDTMCYNSFVYTLLEGTTYQFEGSVEPDTDAIYFWYVNYEELDDNEDEISYTFELENPQIGEFFLIELMTISNPGAPDECIASSFESIFVGPASECELSFSIDTLSANTYYFVSNSTNNLSDFRWDFGDGEAFGPDVVHTFEEAGEYEICLTAYCEIIQDDIDTCTELVVYDTTACNVSFDVDTISLLSYQFTNLTEGELEELLWEFGDGFTTTDENPEHEYNQPGIYMVCLSGICQATQQNEYYCMELNIMDGCQADFQYLPDTLTLLSGNYHFIDHTLAYDIIEWEWDFGDETPVSHEQNPLHYYPFEGEYEVCLKIKTADNCTDEICKTVIVNPFYNLGGNIVLGDYPLNTVQQGDTAVVSLYRFNEEDVLYKVGSELIGDDQNYYSFPHLQSGHYLVRAELTLNSPNYSKHAFAYRQNTMFWYASEVINLSDHEFAKEVHLIETVDVETGSSKLMGSLLFSDDSDIPDIDQFYSVVLMNIYKQPISVVKTDDALNFEFDQLSAGDYKLYADIPGYYSEIIDVSIQNETGIISEAIIPIHSENITGEDEYPEEDHINIYPNPFVDEFSISINSRQKTQYNIIVYDVLSVINYKKQIEVNSPIIHKIDLSHLQSGIYIIHLYDNLTGTSISKKIIKK